jgi:hypothetical protein
MKVLQEDLRYRLCCVQAIWQRAVPARNQTSLPLYLSRRLRGHDPSLVLWPIIGLQWVCRCNGGGTSNTIIISQIKFLLAATSSESPVSPCQAMTTVGITTKIGAELAPIDPSWRAVFSRQVYSPQ